MNLLGITNNNRLAYTELVNERAAPLVKELINDQALNDREDIKPEKQGSRIKVVVCGGIVYVYRYLIPVRHGSKIIKKYFDSETGEMFTPALYDGEGNRLINEASEEAKKHNSRRAKNEIRMLINSNFDHNSKFITLTFRNGSVSDVQDVRVCNQAFKEFVRRLRGEYGNFKYVKVIEFQDSNKRGAVHYHVISDLPYIDSDKLATIWGNGFIGINRISHVDNVGVYISKYMVKDFSDIRLWKEKAYTTSRGNLLRPIVTFGKEAEEIYDDQLRGKKKVYTNSYVSEYQGKTFFEEYNLNRL